jgi:hypothetical protein
MQEKNLSQILREQMTTRGQPPRAVTYPDCRQIHIVE